MSTYQLEVALLIASYGCLGTAYMKWRAGRKGINATPGQLLRDLQKSTEGKAEYDAVPDEVLRPLMAALTAVAYITAVFLWPAFAGAAVYRKINGKKSKSS